MNPMASQNMSRVKLVAIDDTPESLELITESLAREGLEIFTATDPEDGLDIVLHEHPQIVLLDLVMPKMSGMEVLAKIVEFDPGIEVILMTAHYSTESAVEAIKKGASDYLNKPVSIQLLRDRVGRLMEEARQRQRAMAVDSELLSTCQFEEMVGRSPVMWEMFARIRRIAPHFRTVLVTGATGTGKELVARALHRLSPVSGGRYVVCNCSAVVETLFESELFGYVKGAFTGATQDKMGLFEYAHNGTLFLDEIGDMPMNTQAKLLRALQNQEIQRVGSLAPRKVDARVIAATNHDLKSLIAQNRFREDLYYRLSMVDIRTPRLAERKEDLSLIEQYFVRKFAEQYQKPIQGLTQRAQIVLARYGWPGNVRELENVIGSASMMVMGDMIDVADLPEEVRSQAAAAGIETSTGPHQGPVADLSLEEQERLLLLSALERSGGNQSQAARLLRISRDRMRYKMAKHNLK